MSKSFMHKEVTLSQALRSKDIGPVMGKTHISVGEVTDPKEVELLMQSMRTAQPKVMIVGHVDSGKGKLIKAIMEAASERSTSSG